MINFMISHGSVVKATDFQRPKISPLRPMPSINGWQ